MKLSYHLFVGFKSFVRRSKITTFRKLTWCYLYNTCKTYFCKAHYSTMKSMRQHFHTIVRMAPIIRIISPVYKWVIGYRRFETTLFHLCLYFLERKPQTSHVKYFVCVSSTVIYLVIYPKFCCCFSWRALEYIRDGLRNSFLRWARLSLGLHWILNIGSLRQSFQPNCEIFQDSYCSYSIHFFTIILPSYVIFFWYIKLCVGFRLLPVFRRKLLLLYSG